MRTLTLQLSLLALGALGLVACGGGDEDSATEVSPEQAIEQAGNEWAALFAADGFGDSCEYMAQPFCEQIDCERAGGRPIRNCTPPSSEFRNSFEEARVEDVVIRGDNAGARFSNGEVVELVVVGGPTQWLIRTFGRDGGRKLFD